MNRCLATVSMCAISLGTLLAGCQKPADQQTGPDANASSSMADSANKAVKRALEPKPLVVPADTVVSVVLDQSISSKTSKPGDKFTATVESPIEIEGKIAIPKGARADGVVKDAKAAGRFKGAPRSPSSLRASRSTGRITKSRLPAQQCPAKEKASALRPWSAVAPPVERPSAPWLVAARVPRLAH